MIKAAVASALSQLSECGIKYDKEEKNIHTQESSTNTNKKVHLKSILKKFKWEWLFPSESMGSISSISIEGR